MPKEIQSFRSVRLLHIETIRENQSTADRSRYIGKWGKLVLEESVQRKPGSRFLYFTVFTDEFRGWLQTSFGNLVRESERLIFSTENSRYIFEILRE